MGSPHSATGTNIAAAREPLFVLIEQGDLYAPAPLGVGSILIAGGRIQRIGAIESAADVLRATGLGCEVIDARGCIVIPGLVDPHEHLIGAAGEQGFGSRMPEVSPVDLARAGITTVVGCLGTDTTTRSLTALLGKVRQLEVQGFTAYLYTGGFPVPPPTLTGSVMSDLVLIDKVIGVGEIAISDVRSSQPTLPELARLVAHAYVGGTIGGKAGVTHFHTGPGAQKLAPLHALLDQHDVSAVSVYPTHISRTAALMDDAIALARRGSFVDIDTIDADLAQWFRYYRERGGPPDQLTVSSDAHTRDGAPGQLLGQLVACVRDHELPLGEILPLFTRNPAAALKLADKGTLREQADADLVILDGQSLEVRHVFARGRALVKQGQVLIREH